MQYMHVLTGTPKELDDIFHQACSIQTHVTWESEFFTDHLKDLEVHVISTIQLIKFIIKDIIDLNLSVDERVKVQFSHKGLDYLVVVDWFGNITILSFSLLEDNYNLLYAYDGVVNGRKVTADLMGISSLLIDGTLPGTLSESVAESAIRKYMDGQPTELNGILREGFDRLLNSKRPSVDFIVVTDYLKRESKEYLECFNEIISSIAGVRNMISYGGIPVSKKQKVVVK